MSLRSADDRDCEVIWRWRLDDERRGHYLGLPTTYGTHEAWFARNRDRIQVWETNGVPVGMVRVESDGTMHFSVEHSRREEAVPMIRAALGAVRRHGGRLKAVVDADDRFRVGVFAEAGFVEFRAVAMIYKGGL